MTMPTMDQWSYSGDPSNSDLDQVRFYVQDTDSTVRLLADAEINFLVGVWKPLYNNSLIYVASVAAGQVAAKFAGVVRVNADGVAVDLTNLSPAYTALAEQLRRLYELEQSDVEVDVTNLMWGGDVDLGLAPLRFGIGDMDNPAAGQQDYGGEGAFWWQAFDGEFEWAI